MDPKGAWDRPRDCLDDLTSILVWEDAGSDRSIAKPWGGGETYFGCDRNSDDSLVNVIRVVREKRAGYLLFQYEIDCHRSLVFWRECGHNMSRESVRIP